MNRRQEEMLMQMLAQLYASEFGEQAFNKLFHEMKEKYDEVQK